MVQVEKKEIKAILHTQGHTFELLDIVPWKHSDIHFLLREHSFQFLVIVNDFAQPIVVGREGFLIVPLIEPYERDVNYLVEGDTETDKIQDRVVV